MKRRLFLLAVLSALLMALPVEVDATQTEPRTARAADECGDGITWSLDADTLTITGSGAMDDFSEQTPWSDAVFSKLVLRGGVTYIGANAFKNCDALQTVDFADALYEIGAEAFSGCDGLTSVELPASFKVFGEGSFQNCSNLKQIHCNGKFPSFRQNCLWGTYADIYYPAERPWGVEYIVQLEEAFGGRIHFYGSDGTDPVPDETAPPTETLVPTVPLTEAPTVPPQTAPSTEPATEPVTTQAPTETSSAPTTALPAQPQKQEPEQPGAGKQVIVPAVILALSLAGLAVSVSALRRPKGRYSKKRRR